MLHAAAFLTVLATALPACATGVSDADALVIVRKHCVMCHAVKPSHESFQEAPKGVALESTADIRKHAAAIYRQTVEIKAMPLGNQTIMTDDERNTLGQWLKEQP